MDEIKKLKENRKKIEKGLKLSYRKLLEHKIQNNFPLIVSQNGKVIELDPKEELKKLESNSKSVS